MISVEAALRTAVETNNPWLGLIVVRAHPLEAFKSFEGKIPAVWLAKTTGQKNLAKDLLEDLSPEAQLSALRTFADASARSTLQSISVCMAYEAMFPYQSRQRKLRREAKLAKAVSKVLAAAKTSRNPAGQWEMLEAVSLGVQEAMATYKSKHVISGIWVGKLGWEQIGLAALARCERKEFKKQFKELECEGSTSDLRRL